MKTPSKPVNMMKTVSGLEEERRGEERREKT
jgi:hypothetical protein